MKTAPLARYRVPSYPVRAAVLADPDLLRRHLPPAWRATRDLAGAAALFLAANAAGCGSGGKDGGANAIAAAIVAPVFKHGEGRGATGCVAVSPPVFLSEEEAMQAIEEELRRGGVPVERRDVELPGVRIPSRIDNRLTDELIRSMQARLYEIYFEILKDAVAPAADGGASRQALEQERVDVLQKLKSLKEAKNSSPVEEKPLRADAVCAGGKVAVEFVSRKEYYDLGGPRDNSTVQDYDFVETAGWVAQHVKKGNPRVCFGVFYDPATGADEGKGDPKERENLDRKMEEAKSDEERSALWKEYYEKVTRPVRQQSLRLLREQVKDFVDWLKAQGAL